MIELVDEYIIEQNRERTDSGMLQVDLMVSVRGSLESDLRSNDTVQW